MPFVFPVSISQKIIYPILVPMTKKEFIGSNYNTVANYSFKE
jgi:hypothetical protein